MRCGCTTEYDRTDHRHWPDDSECWGPEAIELIRELVAQLEEVWLCNEKADAFLAKVSEAEVKS
jgi:hypothetical protein